MTAGADPAEDLRPFRERLCDALADADPADAGALVDALAGRGLGDGLPVVAPAGTSVAAALAGRPPDDPAITAPLPISFAIPTWWDVAACAVLAGCPVGSGDAVGLVAAALEATTAPQFNLLGVQATTGAAAPLVIVHGPAVDDLGLNPGAGALGPGTRANASLGRAVRLVLADVGLCRPGVGDMATHGHPGKYTWLVAEHQAASPWASLSAVRGLAADASAVTVFAGVGNVEVVVPSTTPDEIVARFTEVLVGLAARTAVLLLPPESAELLTHRGMGHDDLLDALAARGGIRPLVVVTGGAGVKATVVPGWGGPTEPVTRRLDTVRP